MHICILYFHIYLAHTCAKLFYYLTNLNKIQKHEWPCSRKLYVLVKRSKSNFLNAIKRLQWYNR